jgi:ATP-dependent helicase/nuclease subunit A
MRRNRSAVSMPADQAQRDRIVVDLDRNVLVEAAAGTGKTASMVERMVALLATGKSEEIRTLAAVTFTRKAAAELRARFQVRLERAVRETEGEERQRLEKALANIEQVFIGTIHAFCARLLRERPVEANVDLAFEEIDEDADQRLRSEAWEELTASLLYGDTEELPARLDRLGIALEDLEDAFFRFADFPDVDDWPAPGEGREEPDLTDARGGVLRYVSHMRRLAPDLPAQWGNDSLIPHFKRLPRVVSHYGDLASPGRLIEVLSLFDRSGKVVQKVWMQEGRFTGEEAKQEQARWERFREDVVQPALRAWYEYRYPTVLEILYRAREIYDRLRAQRGQLNFQDLLIKAAALLRDKPHVRRYFRDRFRFLLVDEFQDTDPVQAEVMLLLTASDPEETEWRKCVPRPGSLFVVGDPKQSIYRFRRADIVTYNEVKSMIRRGDGSGEQGMLLELSVNFRTTGAILDWVNRAFEPEAGDDEDSTKTYARFPSRDSEASPGYVSLKAGRQEEKAGDLSGLFSLSIPEEYPSRDDAAAYEADRIARTIRWAIDSGRKVTRSAGEREAGKASEVGPDDFMIVTFKRRHLSLYARKLQDLGVPNQVSGGTTLNEVRELKLLHLCLQAVVHPDNPVCLVAALRSELFGVSDAALYALKKAGGRFSYRAAVPEEGLLEGDAEAVRDAFQRMSRYARWLARLPVLSALERMVADLGLMALAASRPGGDVEAGSLAKAIEILRDGQRQTWTSEQIVEQLGELVRLESPYDGISARSGERPVVRIMNLHKVKGLEAPVVFLADPSGEFDHGVEMYIDRSGDRVHGYMLVMGPRRAYRQPMVAQPAGWDGLAEREQAFARAEALRLRYVAATRAGCALVVTRRLGRGKTRWNPWKEFEPFLSGAAELPDPGRQASRQKSPRPFSVAEVEERRVEVESRLEAAMAPTFEVEAAKRYALEAAKGGMPEGEGIHTPEAMAASTTLFEYEGEHGVEWGSVIHSLLRVAMEHPGSDLRGLARAALMEQGLHAGLTETAVDTVNAVMAAEIWQRAMASPRRLVEVPFEMVLERDAAVPMLVRGAIDLVFEEPEGWVIVDYKTDSLPGGRADALIETYAPQVRLYAQSWERITGERVKEMGLYFSRANRFERIVMPAEGGIL